MTATARSNNNSQNPFIPFVAGRHLWDDALKTLTELGPHKTHLGLARFVGEAQALAEASARNWRTLADFQWNAAHELMAASRQTGLAELPSTWAEMVLTLATQEAERRQEALGRLVDAFWPAEPVAADAEAARA
jgi:hypothetical protein